MSEQYGPGSVIRAQLDHLYKLTNADLAQRVALERARVEYLTALAERAADFKRATDEVRARARRRELQREEALRLINKAGAEQKAKGDAARERFRQALKDTLTPEQYERYLADRRPRPDSHDSGS